MPLGLWSIEFLDLNAQRAYPLADDATKMDASGAFTLPDSFLVNLALPIPWALAVDPSRFFISMIAAFAAGYAVSVGYDDGAGNVTTVATATFAAATHTENLSYALSGTGDFADVVGRVAVGTLDDIARQPPGQWSFTYAGGKLDPDVVRPLLRDVSSISVVSGGVTSAPLYGDVQLVAGTNVQISIVDGQIRIDAIDGVGLTDACPCTGATAQLGPIRTINGIGPDAGGNLTIVGNACIDVAAATNGLSLSDTCSQPCCGCTELEALTAELAHLSDQETTLENYLAALQAQVETMASTVLGSRLGDDPCISCP